MVNWYGPAIPQRGKADSCWNSSYTEERMKGISAFPFLTMRSDEESMWRVKLYDDHQEFDRLVKRWQEPIRRLCARMLGDAHRGEDLKQDVFLRLFERRK